MLNLKYTLFTAGIVFFPLKYCKLISTFNLENLINLTFLSQSLLQVLPQNFPKGTFRK